MLVTVHSWGCLKKYIKKINKRERLKMLYFFPIPYLQVTMEMEMPLEQASASM